MATNPQELFEEAKCFACSSNASLADLLKLALLDRILAASGGGGGGSQTPWTSNIDGGGFDLTNVNNIDVTTINGIAPAPQGADGAVQYNDGGAFGGFGTFNDGTNALSIPGTLTTAGLITVTQGTANAGVFASTGYSLTGADATSMVSLAGTWNTSGTPTAIDLNVTNTGSNAGSRLMDLRVGGTSRFAVRVDGTLQFLTGGNFGTFGGDGSGNLFGQGSGGLGFKWNNTSAVTTAVLGTGGCRLISTAVLDWSSTTVATLTPDIGLTREAAGILQVNNGVTGTLRHLNANTLRTGTAYTVGTLPAAGTAGRRAYVTDATAPTFLGALVGGGAVVTPVFDNGAAWVSA